MSDRLELPAGLEPVFLDRAAGAREEAVQRARAGAEEGTLVWVRRPEAPQARKGRVWLLGSEPGLHAALVLRPALAAAECVQLGPVAAVAIGRAVAASVEPMTELHYRWPNDVLLNGGKAAGIWLDGGGRPERVDWLVVSWAVNTHDAPERLGFDAASLQREGGAGAIDAAALLQTLAGELVAAIATWDEAGFAPILRSWRGRMALGGAIRLDPEAGGSVAGVATEVGDDGSLSVRADTNVHRVTLEEFFGLPREAIG